MNGGSSTPLVCVKINERRKNQQRASKVIATKPQMERNLFAAHNTTEVSSSHCGSGYNGRSGYRCRCLHH
ncbi:MAG: hypothetical protein JWO91_2757 [Acidobacteriaceae bacterium]|nr:hypothetical protein [Acidobacteriaceae bacterium]